MSISELNLARKWRPTTFETIVGQDLTIRLLKNSLFKQQFFPVYLLAGQRGCGKTTTGRVFAAAINCHALPEFSQNPQKTVIPCGHCQSCEAMSTSAHPDFIEIDAASHTGVDHVRQIIEATSFLPQLGRKKIYLIDEAHMLSKAAFNAFLKILEEPPKTVLFMMATTDSHKIIDTVRSRCFQLLFDPVSDDVLIHHLATICTKETIPYEEEALALIVRESEGSIRDALNLIERVRLAHEGVQTQSIVATFGYVEEELVVGLLQAIAHNDTQELMQVLNKKGKQQVPSLLWKKIFDCFRICMLLHYGIESRSFKAYHKILQQLQNQLSVERLIICMEMMYAMEQQFIKTTAQQTLLEILLIKMCTGIIETTRPHLPTFPEAIKTAKPVGLKEQTSSEAHITSSASSFIKEKEPVSANSEPERQWLQFLAQVDTLGEPLFASVVKQGHYVETSQDGACWNIALPKELTLFQDTIKKAAPAWKKLVEQIGQKSIDMIFHFNGEKKLSPEAARPRPVSAPPARSALKKTAQSPEPLSTLDIRDAQKWEKTHTLLALFPGTVSEVK